jgi:integrase
VLPKHKTAAHVGKKEIPLGAAVQKLFLPYLEGKADTEIIFSPRSAVQERNAIKRANRTSALTPSQIARDAAREKKPRKYNDTYNKDSYRTAIQRAVCRANKTLPPEEQIEQWCPYMLRRSAGTAVEIAEGLDKSQAMLGHKSPNPTRRYAKGQLKIAEEVARKQVNPFDTGGNESEGLKNPEENV